MMIVHNFLDRLTISLTNFNVIQLFLVGISTVFLI